MINANYMQSTGILLQMNYGHLVGKETKMVITGIIILELLFMQYGLSEKFDGIVRMVLVVAAVVRDVLEKSIAISNLDGSRWL